MIAKFNGLGTATLAIVMVQTAANAQTTVSGESSTPLTTSTSGNITVAEGGELDVTSGTAITVNSNNNVTLDAQDDDDDDDDEAGTVISSGGQNGVAGIVINASSNATITNGGSIRVLEDFTPDDDDSNGVANGPLALASDRYGIHVTGAGSTSVGIINTGAIYVEGSASAGIAIDTAYVGSLDIGGQINVVGDGSVGIRMQSVTGDVDISSNVYSVGEAASAALFQGDIGGTLTLQGAINKGLTFTYEDNSSLSLSRSDVRTGTPALSILGDVGGGILVAVAPVDDDDIDDEDGDGTKDDDDDDIDNDGVDDDEERSGAISSSGNGAAMQIGGTDAITIGTVSRKIAGTDGGYSLVVDGSISGNSVYSRTDAFGLIIGTATGGTTTLTDGIENTGTISATTVDSEATALLIESSGSVSKLYNSGSISASISSPGEGATYAIIDRSGTLTSIVNTGSISANGSSEDTVHAINVGANTTGVVISQFMNADDLETREEVEEDLDEGEEDTTVYTSIVGNIITGSGNDSLLVSHGTVSGDTFLNGGNDTIRLSDEAEYYGDVDFGSGSGLMALSGDALFVGNLEGRNQAVSVTVADNARYAGTVSGGNQTDVTVNGGRFGASGVETLRFRSLTIGSGGALDVYIDGEDGEASNIIVDTATLAAGSKITATITSLENVEGTYNILTATNLTGTADFDAASAALPFIFQGTITTDNNDLLLNIRRKTPTELGLRRAAGEGYNSIITAVTEDDTLSQAILGIDNATTLQEQIDQMLPDHAGGVFDTLTRGSRLATQHLVDNTSIFDTDISSVAVTLAPVYWRSKKQSGDTVGYENSGQGLTFGWDHTSRIGRLGFSYSYLSGKIDNNGGTGKLKSQQHELGAFWRVESGKFYGFAKASAAYVSLESTRTYEGIIDETEVVRTTESDWSGWLASGYAGGSYAFDIGSRFTLKPSAIIEYHWLKEGSYSEDGGGDAIDLNVESRDSNALSVTTTLTASYGFGRRSLRNGIPLTLELEGGQRSVIKSGLGATTAAFTDGDSFTISPDNIGNSKLLEARILGGGFDFTWKLSGRAEQYDGEISYAARASLSVAF